MGGVSSSAVKRPERMPNSTVTAKSVLHNMTVAVFSSGRFIECGRLGSKLHHELQAAIVRRRKEQQRENKGKGRFDGTCHQCDEYGHKAETSSLCTIFQNGASSSSDPVKQNQEPAASNQNGTSNMQYKGNRVGSTPIPSSSLVFLRELSPDTSFDVSDDTFVHSNVLMIEQMSDSSCPHCRVASGCLCQQIIS